MKAFHLVMMLCLITTACGPASTLTPTHTNPFTPEPAATATNTPTVTPTVKPGWLTFQGKDIWLMYPDTWSSEILAGDGPFLRIERNSHDSNLNVARAAIGKFRDATTLEDVDKAMWGGLLRFYELAAKRDRVILESHETIEVGGQPATKRMFSAPVIQDPSQTVHKMLVLVVNGTDVFQIVANAASESALRGPEITDIIASIQFTH
jgi:hypothetical protein